jgi:Mg2+ and Co2+ transporter CorA
MRFTGFILSGGWKLFKESSGSRKLMQNGRPTTLAWFIEPELDARQLHERDRPIQKLPKKVNRPLALIMLDIFQPTERGVWPGCTMQSLGCTQKQINRVAILIMTDQLLNGVIGKCLMRLGLPRDIAGSRDEILQMRRESIRLARDMAYKRTAMLELAREHPALLSADEFDRFNRQIHRYAALVEDAQEYAEHCQFLLEELRAQVEEETNRNLYILTMFSVIFLPATLIASIWGMNVGGIPFSGSPNGFWVVAGLIAAAFALTALVLFRYRFRLF